MTSISWVLTLYLLGITGGNDSANHSYPSLKKETSPTAEFVSAKIPPLLKEVELAYAKHKTIQANFSKELLSNLTKEKKKSSGLIWVQRPDKVRWDTRYPQDSKSLLVSDGRQFWFYSPPFDKGESGQVIIRDAEKAKSELANTLLTGAFSKAQFSKVTKKGKQAFELVPRRGTAGTITRAYLEVDSGLMLIRRVKITHRNGNQADIILSNFELGKSYSSSWFRFQPPANTDIIRN